LLYELQRNGNFWGCSEVCLGNKSSKSKKAACFKQAAFCHILRRHLLPRQERICKQCLSIAANIKHINNSVYYSKNLADLQEVNFSKFRLFAAIYHVASVSTVHLPY